MSSKSRLGKGLGALFPELPGEPASLFAEDRTDEGEAPAAAGAQKANLPKASASREVGRRPKQASAAIAKDSASTETPHHNTSMKVAARSKNAKMKTLVATDYESNNTDVDKNIKFNESSSKEEMSHSLKPKKQDSKLAFDVSSSTEDGLSNTISQNNNENLLISRGSSSIQASDSSDVFDHNTEMSVSRETTADLSSSIDIDEVSEANSTDVNLKKNELPDQEISKAKDLGEQTKPNSTTSSHVSHGTRRYKNKRASIPTLGELTHPSDVFFGGSKTDHSKNEDEATASFDPEELSEKFHMRGGRSSSGTSSISEDKSSSVSADSIVQDKNTKIENAVMEEDPSIPQSSEKVGGIPKNDDSSLIDDKQLAPVQGGYLVELNISEVGPNGYQPRTIFDEDDLKELSDSIREVGVLQPIVVRKRPEHALETNGQTARLDSQYKGAESIGLSGGSSDDGTSIETVKNPQSHSQTSLEVGPQHPEDTPYELIMGERRWRASKMAGLETIPAIVKTTSDDYMLRDALLENLHRVNLNPLEEAAAYQQMIKEFGLTQAELSKSISKSRPQIANTLRLLNLPAVVQKKVAAGILSAGHARALLGLARDEDMDDLAKRIIAEGLSVRSTEEIVAMKALEDTRPKQKKASSTNPWLDSPIRQHLEDRFDTKVAIKGSQKRGRIEIIFSSSEDMDRILGLLMPDQNRQVAGSDLVENPSVDSTGKNTSLDVNNDDGWI